MKEDLKGRAEIEKLINAFYIKVKADVMIGPLFQHIPEDKWPNHLQTMYKFWENVLFYTGDYFGNPLYVHEKLNKAMPLSPQHFERWIELFVSTVDELFNGINAEMAKQKAFSIATVMQTKIFKKYS